MTIKAARAYPTASAANPVDTLYEVLAVVSCYVFALVVSIMLVSVVHFRRRHNDLSDGEPIHGNTTLEIAWTIAPAVVLAVIAVPTVAEIDGAP